MTNLTFTGTKDIESGKLLDVTIGCDGSGPWTACWTTSVPVPYNVTGNETCESHGAGKMPLSDNCSFPVVWYFRDPGYHNLMTIVDNKISKEVRVFTINMFNATHTMPISVVVAPALSSFFAIVILIGEYTVWKNEKFTFTERNISWNQLFSNLFSKDVAFTKVLW